MLPVSLRHAATPPASPQATSVETGAPAPTSLPHPEGLPTRGSTHGDTAPRSTLASLPADVHRHLAQHLDAQSVVTFAATSRAHRAAMTERPGFGQIGQLYPAVKAARLVDESFGEASTSLVMQFASIMIPLRLAKLEAGSVAPEHVVSLLTHLAEAEARPSNLAALHEMEWAAMAAGKIVAALDAHGIDTAAHPALHAALRALTGPPA